MALVKLRTLSNLLECNFIDHKPGEVDGDDCVKDVGAVVFVDVLELLEHVLVEMGRLQDLLTD